MLPPSLTHRIESLIDDLIEEGSVATATLASILVAAEQAARNGYEVALCRQVWSAVNRLESTEEAPGPGAPQWADEEPSMPVSVLLNGRRSFAGEISRQ